jgi:hypothetical protein
MRERLYAACGTLRKWDGLGELVVNENLDLVKAASAVRGADLETFDALTVGRRLRHSCKDGGMIIAEIDVRRVQEEARCPVCGAALDPIAAPAQLAQS